MEDMIMQSPFNFFAENQETYEEAVQKSAEESQSFARVKHFRMDSAGTYSVRILPIAPNQQSNGTWKLDRKGYEYPIKTQVLRIDNPKATGKNDKQFFVNVCQGKFAGLSADLIDTYLKVAEERYGNDEKLMKKIKGSGFEGGLKWNSQRCMYIFDYNKRGDGIQMLTLSYSQYKDLEERKLALWKKMLAKNPKLPCPISSINAAYPVEITRKEENKKTSYTFNIDVISDIDELSEEEINALLQAPRIPDAIYRYNKFHLEATIEFLKQYDAKMEMDVMESKEIEEVIAKIKMELPADDKSHFSFDKKDRNNGESNEEEEDDGNSIESLWKRWEELCERKISDKSDEGQELRDAIRNFIDDNELSVRVTRAKTNEDLLEEIEDALADSKKEADSIDENKKSETDNTPEEDDQTTSDDKEDKEPTSTHTEHKAEERDDNTDESAVGVRERRAARPERRRR